MTEIGDEKSSSLPSSPQTTKITPEGNENLGIVSLSKMADGYLDQIALDYFELSLRSFHVAVRQLACKGEYLEEMFASCMKHRYPKMDIDWTPGSHKEGKDIGISEIGKVNPENIDFSIKSGKLDKSGTYISISGNRLQKIRRDKSNIGIIVDKEIWNNGGKNLIEWLNKHQGNLVILMAPSEITGNIRVYSVSTVSPNHFSYPDFDSWVWKGSAITATLESGIIATIHPSMSWQIWWDIPIKCIDLIKKINVLV